MRPRIDLDAIDADTPDDQVLGAIAMAGYSRLPVMKDLSIKFLVMFQFGMSSDRIGWGGQSS